jgi:hypothetical protein
MSEEAPVYAIASERIAKLNAWRDQRPAVEAAGVAALKRLLPLAHGDTGQSRRIAAFLLGCYNGKRFPFNLTDLRGLDIELFEDCIAVLRMDYSPRVEIHKHIENGAAIFEGLAALTEF